MLPILREKKRQTHSKYRSTNKKKNKKYISKSPNRGNYGYKANIKKYSQPKFGSLTDAENINSEPESTHMQSCDENLLHQSPTKKLIDKKKRLKTKKKLRENGSSSLIKPLKQNLNYHDPYEIYTQNNEELNKRRMKALKEVQSTLALINKDKEEIENFVRERNSVEARFQNSIIKKTQNNQNSRSQIRLKNEKLGQKLESKNYVRGGRELSKVKSEGEFKGFNLKELPSFTDSPRQKNPLFAREKRKSTFKQIKRERERKKNIDFKNLKNNSKNFLKSGFKKPLNFSSLVEPSNENTLGASKEDRYSLPNNPNRRNNSEKLKKKKC